MKLIYIAEGIGPVFQSQVVELLNSIIKYNKNIKIVLLLGVRKEEEALKITNLHQDIQLVLFKSVPLYPILDILTSISLKQKLLTLDVTPDTIFHSRGEYIGIMFYKTFKKLYTYEPKLLIDFRGAGIEEIATYMNQTLLIKVKLVYLKYLYNKYIKKALLFSAVTKELQQYLIEQYKLPTDKFYINHCIAGNNFSFNIDDRMNTRNSLGIKNDDILFVFSTSSSGGKWQNADEIAEVLTKKGYKVLMLTKKKYNIDGVISKYVPYDDVPKYLRAADIGIIIRNDDIVNRVSSPIKFSEYLSCGLPVISNNSVTLIIEIINEYQIGLIVNDIREIEKDSILKLKEINRNNIASVGQKLFSFQVISKGYMNIYNNLLQMKSTNE